MIRAPPIFCPSSTLKFPGREAIEIFSIEFMSFKREDSIFKTPLTFDFKVDFPSIGSS